MIGHTGRVIVKSVETSKEANLLLSLQSDVRPFGSRAQTEVKNRQKNSVGGLTSLDIIIIIIWQTHINGGEEPAEKQCGLILKMR